MNNTNFTLYYNDFKNLINQNYGKNVKIHTSIDNKVFEGLIEQVGDNYIIISNPESSNWYLIFIKNINYIKFLEKINTSNHIY